MCGPIILKVKGRPYLAWLGNDASPLHKTTYERGASFKLDVFELEILAARAVSSAEGVCLSGR